MALFENYEGRMPQLQPVLDKYGFKSFEDVKAFTNGKGVDAYGIVESTQPICFENVKWAYELGAAIAMKEGATKAADAAKMAIESPLLETSISGARGVLLNITGSPDMGLEEVEQAASMVQEAAHPDAHIIFGAAIDEGLDDEIRITVVATGFDSQPTGMAKPVAVAEDKPAEAAKPAEQTQPAAELEVPEFVQKMREPAPTVKEPARAVAEDVQPAPAQKKKREHDPFDDILSMFRDKN